MGKRYDEITPELAQWISQQKLFFVSTAPLAADGHVNCSPKGLDSLRILGPREIAWTDTGGSGIETVAHLRENGRILLMWCAFDGPPRIVRVHGRGEVVTADDPRFAPLLARLPPPPLCRAIIRVEAERIADSCGYGVPLYQFVADRPQLQQGVQRKGTAGVRRYFTENNAASIDGLPGLTAAQAQATWLPSDPARRDDRP